MIKIFILLSFLTTRDTGYRRLVWTDFHGLPTSQYYSSLTVSTINVDEKDSSNGTVYWDVDALFNSEKSWTKSQSDWYLLIHEQGHWDITVIYARKIKKFLSAYQGCSKKKSKSVNRIIETYFTEWRELQSKYDRKTKHGQDVYQQAVWTEKIEKLKQYV